MKRPATLDEYARRHIAYEARRMVETVVEFMRSHPDGQVPERVKRPVIDDALIEATLLHVRLLAEFLWTGKHQRKDRVRATDWVPATWNADWLGRERWDRLNAQVAHLDVDREDNPRWQLRDLVCDCCTVLDEFLREVERRCSAERLAAFAEVREHVDRGLRLGHDPPARR